MQKFGLRTHRTAVYGLAELEIRKEQASALGRAGRKLRLSLEDFQKTRPAQLSAKQEQALLQTISNNVWQLVLQREFLGFIEGNLDWVQQHYNIPPKAISALGGTPSVS